MKCAAQLIGGYLGRGVDSIEAADVPIIMALFKIARSRKAWSTDSWLDLAGYAAIGFDVQQRDQGQRRTARAKGAGRPRKVLVWLRLKARISPKFALRIPLCRLDPLGTRHT